MKAILVRQWGGPEVMQYEEVPKPEVATPGPVPRVLVRVAAIGVNPFDTYMRSGNYSIQPTLPYIPGGDAAGVIEAVGPGSQFIPGQRVWIGNAHSAYAEFMAVAENLVHPLAEHLTFSQGAALGVPYATAYHALFQVAQVKAGETLLIHGASGGVGIALVQMAKAFGLIVLGTAGSEPGREMVRREGAHQVLNHGAEGYRDEILRVTQNRGADIIVEMRADLNLEADFRLVAPRGRIVVVGSRGEAKVLPRDLMSRHASLHAFTLFAATPAELAEINAGLQAGLENRTLRPIIGREFRLEEAPQAHEKILEPGAFGKIILTP